MQLPRKYFTLYVVIGSIVVFSLKDSLNLVHTLLHAIPNPLHSHAFALPHLPEKQLAHDESVPHIHQGAHHQQLHDPKKPLSHDVMQHLTYENPQQVSQPASQRDQKEKKQSAPFTWDIQALFSYQLGKPLHVRASKLFFTPAHHPRIPCYPPSPPPEVA